jgi:ADP-ribose pyrophosphatase YjhB (NUDIX family)
LADGAGVMLQAPGNRFLVLRRSQESDHPGTYCFPGGGVEEGETYEDAARRELHEETGFDYQGPLAQVDDRDGFVTFRAELPEEFDPELNDEHTEARWIEPGEHDAEPLHPGVRATLSEMGFAMDQSIRKRALAFDRATVRSFTVDGRLQVELNPISKANVCPYYGEEIPDHEKLGLDPKRVYMLLRDPEELAKAAETFNGVPLLLIHKPSTADEHPRELTIGTTGTDAAWEDPYLKNTLVVWDAEGIEAIESDEQKELSSGYRYRADMTPGVFNGENYDGVMRDIVGNHVALVEEGRAGPDVVVGDSALGRDAAFEESKHPRAENGQFGSGGGGSPSKKNAGHYLQSYFNHERPEGQSAASVHVVLDKDGEVVDWSTGRVNRLGNSGKYRPEDGHRIVKLSAQQVASAKGDVGKALEKAKTVATANDAQLEERIMKIKTAALPSRKALLVQGAVAAVLAPMIAQDAKPIDLGGVFKGVNRKNYAAQRDNIVSRLKLATDKRLAKDADLEDVVAVIDALKGVNGGDAGEDDVTIDADLVPGAADPADPEKTNPGVSGEDEEEGGHEAFMAKLKAKLDDATYAKVVSAMSPSAAPAQGATDEEKDKNEEPGAEDEEGPEKKPEFVSKGAMDKAINAASAKAVKDTITRLAAVREAENICRPHIGELAIAMDSAEAVYKHTLQTVCPDRDLTGIHPSAFRAMVEMLPTGSEPKTPRLAQDAKKAKAFEERYPGADRIKSL